MKVLKLKQILCTARLGHIPHRLCDYCTEGTLNFPRSAFESGIERGSANEWGLEKQLKVD